MLHINKIANYPLFRFVSCGPFTQIQSMFPDFSKSSIYVDLQLQVYKPSFESCRLYTIELIKMGNFKKYQILILSLIVVLLSLTPFLSSSIRSAHLYIVINILILTVGVESGLLSAFPKPPNEEKKSVAKIAEPKKRVESATNLSTTNKTVTPSVKQSNMEKISTVAIMDAKKVKMSSGPSIFFISNGDIAGEEVLKDEEIGGEVCSFGEAMAEQELSTKADDFIKNFYKQLKMQREES